MPTSARYKKPALRLPSLPGADRRRSYAQTWNAPARAVAQAVVADEVDFGVSFAGAAFNGLALAIVRTRAGECGKLVLTATSAGLRPATVELSSAAP